MFVDQCLLFDRRNDLRAQQCKQIADVQIVHKSPLLHEFIENDLYICNNIKYVHYLLVKAYITRYQRSLIAQLKCDILQINYETDIYQGIVPENRLCKMCDMNVPEDELHLVLHCPSLENVRPHIFALFTEPEREMELSDVYQLKVLSWNWQNWHMFVLL